eukprot:scaffold183389_cov35-Tisochrysis_lutea.AAC.2
MPRRKQQHIAHDPTLRTITAAITAKGTSGARGCVFSSCENVACNNENASCGSETTAWSTWELLRRCAACGREGSVDDIVDGGEDKGRLRNIIGGGGECGGERRAVEGGGGGGNLSLGGGDDE